MVRKSTIWSNFGNIADEIAATLPSEWIFGGILARADIAFLDEGDETRWTAMAVRVGSKKLGAWPTYQGKGATPVDAVRALRDILASQDLENA